MSKKIFSSSLVAIDSFYKELLGVRLVKGVKDTAPLIKRPKKVVGRGGRVRNVGATVMMGISKVTRQLALDSGGLQTG